MNYLESLKEICRHNPQTVIFAEGNDESVVTAAKILSELDLANPVLFGGGYEIRDLAAKMNVASRGLKIVNPNHEKEKAPYISKIIDLSISKKLNRTEAGQIAKDPTVQAIMRLKSGNCDIVFAGNNSRISPVVSKGLKWSGVVNSYKRVFSMYLLISPDNKDIFAFSDCSINIEPNPTQLAEIAVNTATSYQLVTGRQARVAFLSFSTKGSAQHKNIDRIKEAIKIFTENGSGFICDGELQFDAAVDQTIAQKKAPNGCLNGKANVFIFPSLNSANIAQKIAEQIGGYISIGPMIMGLNDSLHALSKGCSVNEIINSVLVASAFKIKIKSVS